MRERPGGTGGLLALTVAVLLGPFAAADVFHLTSGGRVEGELLGQDAGQYRIRTVLGTVTIAANAVEKVESAPSPFQEYDRRAAQAADTAGDQFLLAQWCEEQGLLPQRLQHLRRAFELDPDHPQVRQALGYVKVGEFWVNGRAAPQRNQPAPGDAGSGEAQAAQDAQKLALAIQGSWRRRFAAIRSSLLDSLVDRLVAQGRQRVAEVKDPLAIVPLVQVLSEGNVVCREVLVDALARFPDDAATVNLAALALVDPDAGIRQRVIAELVRRHDARVTGQFRKALESGDEVLVRHGAQGLGALGATEAIPELIGALTAQRNKLVEIGVPRYLNDLGNGFGGSNTYIGTALIPVNPVVGISNPAASLDLERVRMNVTVFRTEVLEALRHLTGKDFGFDATAWARWYQENRS